jgi:hypothetical protein
MSWAIITIEGTNPQLVTAVLDVLRNTGEDVSLVFRNTKDSANPPPRDIDSTTIPTIEAVLGAEGFGYYLNRCIEKSREVDGGIEWFLVLGGNLDPDLVTEDILMGINTAIDTQLSVLGLAGENSQVSRDDFLDILHTQRHGLLSGGADGFMIVKKEIWNSVSGFREDIGGWGTEIHFALDCLGAGHKTIATPWRVGPNPSFRQEHNYLVATLVAFGSFASHQGLLAKIRFLTRTARIEHLKSPKMVVRKVYRAREILRTRRFLESGR